MINDEVAARDVRVQAVFLDVGARKRLLVLVAEYPARVSLPSKIVWNSSSNGSGDVPRFSAGRACRPLPSVVRTGIDPLSSEPVLCAQLDRAVLSAES